MPKNRRFKMVITIFWIVPSFRFVLSCLLWLVSEVVCCDFRTCLHYVKGLLKKMDHFSFFGFVFVSQMFWFSHGEHWIFVFVSFTILQRPYTTSTERLYNKTLFRVVCYRYINKNTAIKKHYSQMNHIFNQMKRKGSVIFLGGILTLSDERTASFLVILNMK